MRETEGKEEKKPAPVGQSGLPLFYKDPVLLLAGVHGDLRLIPKQDFRFTANTNAVPIMVSEFAGALHSYAIVFAGDPVMPLVVLGLKQENIFVNAKGEWECPGTYVPAYVRRYPFTFITQGTGFALGIDMACERLITGGKAYKDATALFEGGKPSKLTQDAINFCGALHNDHLMTRAFSSALAEQGLLIEQHVNAVSSKGRPYGLQGFQTVDARKLAQLPDAVVLDWHKKGWLGLIHLHLASLGSARGLIDRIGIREGALDAKID